MRGSMSASIRPAPLPKFNLAFALMTTWLIILWIAGGASRADVMGQVVTRTCGWTILIIMIMFARRSDWRWAAPVVTFVTAALLPPLLQLIPLPPSVWLALPGRDVFADVATIMGEEQPWRPLSLSPGATFNALSSLIVPVVTCGLAVHLRSTDQWRVATLLMGLMVASCLLGTLQLSGARFDHPLINEVSGMVGGSFANRNHFALFCAIGCVLAPAWAFRKGGKVRWRGPAAISIVMLFGLLILASGSRAGLLVGALGFALGFFLIRNPLFAEFASLPRWMRTALMGTTIVAIGGVLALGIEFNRAESLQRALGMASGEDMRSQARPIVIAIIAKYFPFGTGVGTFDPIFRIDEPSQLLNQFYLNHAHNDLLEVALESGLMGVLLLGTAIAWWLWRSWRAWCARTSTSSLLQRLGSAMLLLILIASFWDYPARTPMMMAMIVIAAIWLCDRPSYAVVRKS